MSRGHLGDIADLLNPAPRRERDPEHDMPLALEGPAQEESDEELLASAREAMAGGTRMMPDIVMDDPAYAGRRTTRSARATTEAEAEAESDSEVEDYGSDEKGKRELPPPQAGRKVSRAPEWASRRDEVKLEAAFFGADAGAADAARAVAERATRDAARARAVRAQRALWDAALEARIRMAAALASSARIPRGLQLTAARAATPELAAAIGNAAAAARGATLDLCSLSQELLTRGADVSALGACENVKAAVSPEDASPEDVWEVLSAQIDGARSHIDAAIDRWQRKALLSGASISQASFKTFNQSVSSQVAALSDDLPRLVERSQLRQAEVAPLAHPSRTETSTAERSDGLELLDPRDPETYEDTEFYSTLLKEFLDAAGPGIGANGYRSAPKKRKLVDRRASKGRKIRYNVNEKLVNFMAPEDDATSELSKQLFRNLFGGSA